MPPLHSGHLWYISTKLNTTWSTWIVWTWGITCYRPSAPGKLQLDFKFRSLISCQRIHKDVIGEIRIRVNTLRWVRHPSYPCHTDHLQPKRLGNQWKWNLPTSPHWQQLIGNQKIIKYIMNWMKFINHNYLCNMLMFDIMLLFVLQKSQHEKGKHVN